MRVVDLSHGAAEGQGDFPPTGPLVPRGGRPHGGPFAGQGGGWGEKEANITGAIDHIFYTEDRPHFHTDNRPYFL